MKVIFLGTPQFAATVMKRLLNSRHNVLAAVAQPDRASGRKVIPSPVKALAAEAGIPCYQFESVSREGIAVLKELNADIAVTAAFGQILSRTLLSLTPHGVINVHASLLPKYRGASPIQQALLSGDAETGVTIMKTEYELDSGDIILQKTLPLAGVQNAGEASDVLALLGAEALVEALDSIEDGSAVFTPQNAAEATFCRKFSKEDGKLDFNLSATELYNRIRAFTPWPSAYCDGPNGRVKLLSAVPVEIEEGLPGEVLASEKNSLVIKCGGGALKVLVLQGEGGRALKTADYLNGRPVPPGAMFK